MPNPHDTFLPLFHALAHGTPSEIKLAKKTIQHEWSMDKKRTIIPAIKQDFFVLLAQMRSMDDPVHQSAILSGTSLLFLSYSDEEFEILSDVILWALQQPDGHVRSSAIHTGQWLTMSLSERLHPFMWPAGKSLTKKQKEQQHVARGQISALMLELEALISRFETKRDKRCKYLSSMKPSVAKSLNYFYEDVSRTFDRMKERETAEHIHDTNAPLVPEAVKEQIVK